MRQSVASNGALAAQVMVGEGIAPLTATPERSVTVSRYSALRHEGCCHQHRLPWISSVKQHQVGVSVVQPITVPVMCLYHVLCLEV
jgi:hypothetical protein